MAAFLYGSRPDHFVLRCYVYSHHLRMCNRSCDCDHSHSLEPDRQAGDPFADQIGGIGLIALASIIFISLNKKISLKNRRMIQESNLEQMSGLVTVVRKWFLRICSGRNRSCRLCSFVFPGIGTAVSALLLQDYVPLVNVTTI